MSDEWFRQFCNTLNNSERNMQAWLKMDLQENMLNWKYGNQEVRLTACQ